MKPFQTHALGIVAIGAVTGAAALVAALPVVAQTTEFPACERFPIGEETYACDCPADAVAGSVWGSSPYTADSDVCAAARHQGVIGPDGGAVLAVGQPGQDSYTGSDMNGITSRDWGSYGTSIVFEAKGPRSTQATFPSCTGFDTTLEVVECSCAPGEAGGSVWGNGPYTADSDICAAAVHTGVIGPDGGDVRALRTAGLESYFGSEFNGVTTRNWASYGTSFVLDWN